VALATDYDGTLARQGRVDAATIEALREVRHSGRKVILVTGRDLPDLQSTFSELELFDLVVAENGALLFDPATQEETPLAEPPAQAFVDRLREMGVAPLSVGRTIVATWVPNEKRVLEAIHDLALELHIVFNKGAVMVLPSDVNKAWGLRRALRRLGLSPHNVVAIGDAENDQAFLGACGCAVAVANALPSVKAKADLVVADNGAGVIELAHMLVQSDLRRSGLEVPRRQPVLGTRPDSSPIRLSPFETILVAGGSGAGKSTIVTALIEQMQDLGFQFCVVDPEGDHSEFPDAVVLGDARQEPRAGEVARLLAKPHQNVVINLLAVDPPDRPRFLGKILSDIAKLRSTTGRPHWLVFDEAHHTLPAEWDPALMSLPAELPPAIGVTVHPEQLAPHFLELVATVVGVGDGALSVLESFCRVTGRQVPQAPEGTLEPDQVLMLTRDGPIEIVAPQRPRERRKRHVRKYAVGELGEDKSFYFRGPEGALNLRAQNLTTFLQMAAGVDDRTWLHHLRAGEYSRWVCDSIKDPDLAAEVRAIEADTSLSARESRQRLKDIIDRRYTGPARKG
jgi:HAD superfamily hydrolase (TIGR01484 family)